MTFSNRIVISMMGIFFSLFVLVFSAEAAATVENIQYKVDEGSAIRVIIQGKNLRDLTKDQQIKMIEVKSDKEEPQKELSFSERILLNQEKKEQVEKTMEASKKQVREFSFENSKMSKKLKVSDPLIVTTLKEDSFSLKIPDHAVGRWGESMKAEFLPADKKAGRKLDQIEYIFVPNSRPKFTPTYGDALKGKTIILDPGHGGADVGAVGLNGTKEKDVNLAIALQMRDELKKWGANPVLTRDIDTFAMDELGDRVRCGLQNKGDIFVSLHSDAALNRNAKGFTVYYYGDKDLLLAKSTEKSLKEVMQTQDRGARSANFFVMKRNSLPAILIEMGFISNLDEEKDLMNPDYQRDMVEGTVQGLANYFFQKSR